MNSGPFIVYTDTNGIGWCRESEDGCPQYDGKRCLVTGCRPSGICEPWAIAAARRCAELERQLADARKHADAYHALGRPADYAELRRVLTTKGGGA